MDTIKNNTGQQLRLQCGTCHKTFKINKPQKPGQFTYKCPHCANPITLDIKPKNVQMPKPEQRKADDAPQRMPRIEAPVLGELKPLKPGVYGIASLARVNRPYKVVCPKCGNDVALLPTVSGELIVERCKCCGTAFAYKATGTVMLKMPEGALRWGGGLLRRAKTVRLNKGANTIGRKDATEPANIMIEGDNEMSRRSVEIMVKPQGAQGFSYTLKVLRTTNPVFVNGRPIGSDESVLLNYGDTICLGKTNISFIKID